MLVEGNELSRRQQTDVPTKTGFSPCLARSPSALLCLAEPYCSVLLVLLLLSELLPEPEPPVVDPPVELLLDSTLVVR